jgi:signal transduction histidine kinase/DNA-binding response OmpR family regulator
MSPMTAKTRILLVEDNPGDARLIKEVLSETRLDWHLVHVDRLERAFEALKHEELDVVLLDLTLPDAQGVDTVRRLQEVASSLPVVVLTGLDDDVLAIRAMQEGAQDYLVKGHVTHQLLARSLRYAIERSKAEEDARRLVREKTARAEAELAASRFRFLADVSQVLGTTIDYQTTLSSVAQLAVQDLADVCVIDVVEENGEFRRVALAGPPEDRSALTAFQGKVPSTGDLAHPIVRAWREQKSFFWPELRDSDLQEGWLGTPRATNLSPTSLMLLPLRAGGRTLGTLSLARLNEKRRSTQEELNVAEDLAGRIALAIDNARLYRAREEVIGIVSHDLRNPLNVINLALAGLKAPDLPLAKREKQVEKIQRSVARMNGLIQDLLDVTRIEGGRLPITSSQQDTGSLAFDAFEMMRTLADDRSIVFTLKCPPGLPPVLADRERSLQVFSNLIGNALKFTPEGGEVTLSAQREGQEIVFAVSDTGSGIPPDDLPRIFDRFWQATRDARAGAGLGLAISRGIVQAHGGKIWVESKVGQGSTFFFTLPVEAKDTARAEQLARPETEQTFKQPSLVMPVGKA